MTDPVILEIKPRTTYTLEHSASGQYALVSAPDSGRSGDLSKVTFDPQQIVDLKGDANNVVIVIPSHFSIGGEPRPRLFFDAAHSENIHIINDRGAPSDYFIKAKSLTDAVADTQKAPATQITTGLKQQAIVVSLDKDRVLHVTRNGEEVKAGSNVGLDKNTILHAAKDGVTVTTTPAELSDLDVHNRHDEKQPAALPDGFRAPPIPVWMTKAGRPMFADPNGQTTYRVSTEDHAVTPNPEGAPMLTFGEEHSKISLVVRKGATLAIIDKNNQPLMMLDGDKSVTENWAAYDVMRAKAMEKVEPIARAGDAVAWENLGAPQPLPLVKEANITFGTDAPAHRHAAPQLPVGNAPAPKPRSAISQLEIKAAGDAVKDVSRISDDRPGFLSKNPDLAAKLRDLKNVAHLVERGDVSKISEFHKLVEAAKDQTDIGIKNARGPGAATAGSDIKQRLENLDTRMHDAENGAAAALDAVHHSLRESMQLAVDDAHYASPTHQRHHPAQKSKDTAIV